MDNVAGGASHITLEAWTTVAPTTQMSGTTTAVVNLPWTNKTSTITVPYTYSPGIAPNFRPSIVTVSDVKELVVDIGDEEPVRINDKGLKNMLKVLLDSKVETPDGRTYKIIKKGNQLVIESI